MDSINRGKPKAQTHLFILSIQFIPVNLLFDFAFTFPLFSISYIKILDQSMKAWVERNDIS